MQVPSVCTEKIDAARNALTQGHYATAKRLYQEILQQEPEYVPALDGLGVILCQEDQTEDAIQLFSQALDLVQNTHPANPDWEASILCHLGLSYRTLGLPHDALDAFTESAKLVQPDGNLILNLGQLHYELEQYPQAAGQFRLLAELQPENPSAWLTLGFILANLDKHDEAVEALRNAEKLNFNSPEIYFYLAESLRKSQRYDESLPHYERMLPIAAEYPQAVHGYGKSLLALGNLEPGWEAMEFRIASSFGTWERHHLPNWSPQTDGLAFPAHSHVLAYSEEGIGADLMFASCLPDLINSVEHCTVECENSLHTLFRRSFPRADFVPLADDYVHPDGNPWNIAIDSQIAFGSLPRYFRRDIEDFPLRKAYLVPDREKVANWSHRLTGLGDTKKVGILWNGTWTNEKPKQTALPLQNLRRMMSRHQSASWFNLQHGSRQQDMSQQIGFAPAPRIFPEAFQYDLDTLAALLVALDLVITPPGYIAHLAGALGVRTWLLVPECPDWRHTIDSTTQARCIWHPSVKMYQQAKGQTWQDFFAILEDDLMRFLTTYRPPEEIPTVLTFTERKSVYSKTA
ncbi:MAG: tetratricopeptide repeat protein [Planctomycetaceae bacterium]|nr:tetratricopeptide repeat protein [Planctomycetaceae bacterium]